MNLYLLTNTNTGPKGYDECDGFVVAAQTAARARVLAGELAGDEGEHTWLSADFSAVRRIAASTPLPEGIVLRSFNAG